jgi:hypothetical protein
MMRSSSSQPLLGGMPGAPGGHSQAYYGSLDSLEHSIWTTLAATGEAKRG